MEIPHSADNPPSPSTDHTETLSDIYGDESEVMWVMAIENRTPFEAIDDPDFEWFTGAIGYRTCYKSVSDEQWSEFKIRYEEQVLRRWRYEAGLGADPDGNLAHWKMFWHEDSALEGAEVAELRMWVCFFSGSHLTDTYGRKFKEEVDDYKGRTESAALNCFIFVDEQAVNSLLDDSDVTKDEQQSPYIWVAHAHPDVEPDLEHPDKYEGHYKLPLEKVCDFWELVGMDHMNMAEFAPNTQGGLGGAAFDTMYRWDHGNCKNEYSCY